MNRPLEQRILTDTEIQETLSMAAESMQKLEFSTQRIQAVLQSPLEKSVRVHVRRLSDKILTAGIVIIFAIVGLFATLMSHITTAQENNTKELTERIVILEAALKAKYPQP